MTARDDLTRLLDAADEAGATLTGIRWGLDGGAAGGLTVLVPDCGSYTALCAALGAKPDGGRLSSGLRNPFRAFEALTRDDRVLIQHFCWPHLDCWDAS